MNSMKFYKKIGIWNKKCLFKLVKMAFFLPQTRQLVKYFLILKYDWDLFFVVEDQKLILLKKVNFPTTK